MNEDQEKHLLEVPAIPWIGRRVFYGWVIVAVGIINQFLQGIAIQGFSSYLGPLQRDFGWSRAVLAGPRSVTQVQNSVLGPIEGFLIDKFGPRSMAVLSGEHRYRSWYWISRFADHVGGCKQLVSAQTNDGPVDYASRILFGGCNRCSRASDNSNVSGVEGIGDRFRIDRLDSWYTLLDAA